MALNPDLLRYALGLKVRRKRSSLGLGLKELAARAGLSVSYLSEIEKGRKYPKPEKILALAEALEVDFDDLVALKGEDEHDPVRALIASPFLQEFPWHHFGLQAQDLLGLFAEAGDPRAQALIRTVLEIGRTYDVRVEHFLFAALRSYQATHDNHFPELEAAAKAFLDEQGCGDAPTVDAERLRQVLERRWGYRVDEERIPANEALAGLRAIQVAGPPPELMVNGRLLPTQRAFQYGREIGYRYLGMTARSATSSPLEVTSFEQVINDFRAAYFAGALLINEAHLVERLAAFCARKRWSSKAFLALMQTYRATPETFFYRLSQVLPGRLGLSSLFFLRFAHRPERDQFRLTKNLNMSPVPVPHGIGLNEHYCRRWPGLAALLALAAPGDGDRDIELAVQRSRFTGGERDGDTFFVISVARPLSLNAEVNASVSLGFLIDDAFRERVRFADDPAVPEVEVGLTCERCGIADCQVRAARPALIEEAEAKVARAEALAALVAD